MSLIDEAHVQIALADFINTDPTGKLNIIGGGILFIGSEPSTGASTPFFAGATVWIPQTYAGTEYALTIELHDVTTGRIVSVPTPDGQLQALRAQQVVTVERIQVQPGFVHPQDMVGSHSMVLGFPGGVPLTPGHSYEWRVQIDGQSRGWFHRFHVLGPVPGPVFGGPANPPTIPGYGYYTASSDTPGPEGDPPAQTTE